MKKVIAILAMVSLATAGYAQFAGYPLADTAAADPQGTVRLQAGFGIADDVDVFGVRANYEAIEGLSLFLDVGQLSPDGGDDVTSFQIGGLYSLAVEAPIDLALRLALYKPEDIEAGPYDIEIWGANATVVGSKMVGEGLDVYGAVGFDYRETEVSGGPRLPPGAILISSSESEEDDTELALALGVLYTVNETVSLYGEIGYVDDEIIGGGVRIQL